MFFGGLNNNLFFLAYAVFSRNEKTKLLFCTTGILLRKLAVAPVLLTQFDSIIADACPNFC